MRQLKKFIDANLKDFINLERYFRKKPAIFNKYYQTNLLQIVDLLPPINEEERQKFYAQNNMNFMKKKKPQKNEPQEKTYEQQLMQNVTLAYRHETDRLHQDLQINEYTFTGLLGRGAHSVVRLCKSNELEDKNKQYACKILWFDKIRKKYFIKPKQLFEMVNNQIVLLKAMKHPNIISIKEAIYLKEKQRMFLIIQHCSKGPITKLMNSNLTMEDNQWWQMVKLYFRQFVSGIKFMHDRDIVHRDIKPENLLIGEKNELKIIDFNVSLTIQKDKKIKITNKFIGTKGYAAPQLILDLDKQKFCDGKKIDIWAMGITLVQLLQRRHPYPVKTLPELIKVLEIYKLQSLSTNNQQKQSIEPKYQNTEINYRLRINQNYPQQLKDLLFKMLKFQNQKRISIRQIQTHSWLKINN